MFAAAVNGAASGPGSAATPGIAGGVSAAGCRQGGRRQEQRSCQHRADECEIRRWSLVLMVCLAFGLLGGVGADYGMIVIG